jgi:ABC-2 type transport system permease protein
VAPLLGLPGWVSDLSPFAHVPRVPAEPMAWGPVLALVAVAAVAVAVGLVGYRRRDLG